MFLNVHKCYMFQLFYLKSIYRNMKNRIILHNVKKIIPKTKIQKKPIKSIRPVSMKKFHKNQQVISLVCNAKLISIKMKKFVVSQLNFN